MSVAGAEDGVAIDRRALNEALELAAQRCGRLSNDQVRALRRRRRGIAAAATTLSAAAALLFVGVDRFALPFAPAPVATAHWTRSWTTRPGEQGTATLVDGTTIRLNGASRVAVDYAADRRTVRLVAGQAFFDVAHDAARPFLVQAGRGEARVLGTAFDLDMTRGQVALAVYRGAVGFDAAGGPGRVVVRAGWRSTVRGGTVAAPTRFDPTLPDWRQGWIDTGGMRLDDLVDVLERGGTTPIVRPEGALARLVIAGRFRTDRPRDLLAAIGDGLGFTVVEGPEGLSLRPAAGPAK